MVASDAEEVVVPIKDRVAFFSIAPGNVSYLLPRSNLNHLALDTGLSTFPRDLALSQCPEAQVCLSSLLTFRLAFLTGLHPWFAQTVTLVPRKFSFSSCMFFISYLWTNDRFSHHQRMCGISFSEVCRFFDLEVKFLPPSFSCFDVDLTIVCFQN